MRQKEKEKVVLDVSGWDVREYQVREKKLKVLAW